MSNKKLNRIGYISAAVTFSIATYILFAHYQGFDGDYEGIGLLFIPIALVLNLFVLIYIWIFAYTKKIEGPFRSIYAMLLNIPFAIFCLWFAIYLMQFYRVTVINDTNFRITCIRLTGCDEKSIDKLEPGEEETVWITIPRDCSLDISYFDDNKNTKQDNVAGYLCSGMGQHANYHISGNSNPKY